MDTLIPIGLAMVTVILLVATVTLRKQKKEKVGLELPDRPFESASSAATDSTPPSVDGERNGSRSPDGPLRSTPQTPREQMEADLERDRQRGVCVMCGGHAEKATPKFVVRRSWFDWIHRKLNSLAPQQREIKEEFDPSVRHDLCAECQPIARGHMNSFMTDRQLEVATLAERHNQAYREFQRYGLYERMREDVNAIKRGRKKKQAPTLQIVPSAKTATNDKG